MPPRSRRNQTALTARDLGLPPGHPAVWLIEYVWPNGASRPTYALTEPLPTLDPTTGVLTALDYEPVPPERFKPGTPGATTIGLPSDLSTIPGLTYTSRPYAAAPAKDAPPDPKPTPKPAAPAPDPAWVDAIVTAELERHVGDLLWSLGWTYGDPPPLRGFTVTALLKRYAKKPPHCTNERLRDLAGQVITASRKKIQADHEALLAEAEGEA